MRTVPTDEPTDSPTDAPNDSETDSMADAEVDSGTDTAADVHVPEDDSPIRCPYCERPFRTAQLRALHFGTDHAEVCTADQREAYERAREAEADELFVYHLKTVAALVGLYAFFLLGYMALAAMQA